MYILNFCLVVLTQFASYITDRRILHADNSRISSKLSKKCQSDFFAAFSYWAWAHRKAAQTIFSGTEGKQSILFDRRSTLQFFFSLLLGLMQLLHYCLVAHFHYRAHWQITLCLSLMPVRPTVWLAFVWIVCLCASTCSPLNRKQQIIGWIESFNSIGQVHFNFRQHFPWSHISCSFRWLYQYSTLLHRRQKGNDTKCPMTNTIHYQILLRLFRILFCRHT